MGSDHEWGGWLRVDEQAVDILLRDLDVVEQWWREAEEGRFEIHNVEGHLAGMPTYVLVGCEQAAFGSPAISPLSNRAQGIRRARLAVERSLLAGARGRPRRAR